MHRMDNRAISKMKARDRISRQTILRFGIKQVIGTAYGKTPTAFMQSDSDAVNLAAVMALRDAGAHFITSFVRVPGVMSWLENPEESQ